LIPPITQGANRKAASTLHQDEPPAKTLGEPFEHRRGNLVSLDRVASKGKKS